MKWAIWSYQLPLRFPLAVLGEDSDYRQGFIIGQKQNDIWKYGEAAPLPSFHKITYNSVFEELKQYFKNHRPPRSSVSQFAIDMLSLKASQKEEILINSLNSKDIAENKILLRKSGCIKIKVGRRSLEEDLDHLRLIRTQVSNNTKLRLDANGLWDRDQAQFFIDRVQEYNIEYIEEPTRDSHDIQYLKGMDVALDESLDLNSECIDYPQVSHIIIKPTLHGGKMGLESWQKKTKNKQIILSSTFESSLGIWHLGHLASSVVRP